MEMQQYTPEYDSSDNSSDKNNSDSNSTKRKPVSLACLVCKGKHMRCKLNFANVQRNAIYRIIFNIKYYIHHFSK